MSSYVTEVVTDLIEDPRLCNECVGNSETCHGDFVCEVLGDIFADLNQSMWIPVTERLPETEDHVLVTSITKAGQRNVYLAYYMHKSWHGQMRTPVIAWMPLPIPYVGDSDEA